jgi:gamma-glutamyltranspeptidase
MRGLFRGLGACASRARWAHKTHAPPACPGQRAYRTHAATHQTRRAALQTGLGGDAFALFYDAAERKVKCLAGNGAAPAGLTLEAIRAAGVAGTEMPLSSALTVTVPGAAALWEDAVARWGGGKKALADVLEPAVQLAEKGYAVGPTTAWVWQR